MSVPSPAPTEEPTPAPSPAPAGSDDAKPAEGGAPDWEGEFDPERAARLVANLRESEKKMKARLAEFEAEKQAREDAEKTEAQKLADRLAKAESEAQAARRDLLVTKAAAKYGIPETLAGFLSGDSEEEIEEKAKALAEYAGGTKPPANPIPGKPKPTLVPGSGEGATEDFDPDAVAAKIRAVQ
jgi:hypothetical protein